MSNESEAYSLGSINVDATKELFAFLGQVYPFVDETSKDAFALKVAALDSAGNPNEVENPLPVPAPIAAASEPAAETVVATTPDNPAGTDAATVTPDGTATVATAEGTAPAPTAEAPAPTNPEADARVAELERQLADAKAAAAQTPPEPPAGS